MKNRGIFLDTSFLYALLDSKDKNHNIAKNFLSNNSSPLLTTNFVFDEIITIIRYDFGFQPAKDLGELLIKSEICRILRIQEEDETLAWNIFKQFEDQTFSFTDCTSFAFMKRLALDEACSFDRHFSVMGFTNAFHRLS